MNADLYEVIPDQLVPVDEAWFYSADGTLLGTATRDEPIEAIPAGTFFIRMHPSMAMDLIEFAGPDNIHEVQ